MYPYGGQGRTSSSAAAENTPRAIQCAAEIHPEEAIPSPVYISVFRKFSYTNTMTPNAMKPLLDALTFPSLVNCLLFFPVDLSCCVMHPIQISHQEMFDIKETVWCKQGLSQETFYIRSAPNHLYLMFSHYEPISLL